MLPQRPPPTAPGRSLAARTSALPAAALAIQDDERQLCVLTERAQGAARCAAWTGSAGPAASQHDLLPPAASLLWSAPLPPLLTGGASLRSGELELMVHRRTLAGACCRWALLAGCGSSVAPAAPLASSPGSSARPTLDPTALPPLRQTTTAAWASR